MSSLWGIVFYIRNIILLGLTTKKHYSAVFRRFVWAQTGQRGCPALGFNAGCDVLKDAHRIDLGFRESGEIL